jgi:hypothetical protein
MRLAALAALCMATGTFALVSCGGEGSGGGDGRPLSKQQFTAKANAICKQADDRVVQLTRPTDLPSYGSYAASLEPIAHDLQDKLESLRPPQQEKAAVDRLLSDLKDAVAKIPQLRAAAEAGDPQKAQKIANDFNASPFNTEASDLGLKECAENVEPSG